MNIKGMGDEEGDEPITNREYPGGRVGLGARVIKVYLTLILMVMMMIMMMMMMMMMMMVVVR